MTTWATSSNFISNENRDNLKKENHLEYAIRKNDIVIEENSDSELEEDKNSYNYNNTINVHHKKSDDIRQVETIYETNEASNDNKLSEIILSLFREYFSRHDMIRVKEAFELEKPRTKNSLNSTKSLADSLNLGKIHQDNKKKDRQYKSVLDTFVNEWIKISHQTKIDSSNKLERENDLKNEIKQKKMKKPGLHVILPESFNISSEEIVVQSKEQNEQEEYNENSLNSGKSNTLGRPGSTPRNLKELNLGQPGSTPRIKMEDLPFYGINDIPDSIIPTTNIVNSLSENNENNNLLLDNIKHETEKTKNLLENNHTKSKSSKKVCLGEEGSTPTKEYIFFRNTPPSFVTETLEEAYDIHEAIQKDPSYNKLIESIRFVELNSSDVGKYTVGQMVSNLGSSRSIHGKVYKKYGSKQCGESGPGTLVIDTLEENITENQKNNETNESKTLENLDSLKTIIHDENPLSEKSLKKDEEEVKINLNSNPLKSIPQKRINLAPIVHQNK